MTLCYIATVDRIYSLAANISDMLVEDGERLWAGTLTLDPGCDVGIRSKSIRDVTH